MEDGWINWAGPPDLLVADGERGFASEAFAEAMGRAGTLYVPSAAYAPWQKGKVERLNQTVRAVITKCVLHRGLKGVSDMTAAGTEAASAINARPGPSGVSPAMMLFGQRLKLYGDLYAGGEPVGHHPDANDPSSALARRLKIRVIAKQAMGTHHARELLRRAVSARSRVLEGIRVGEIIFFYRDYPTGKRRKPSAREASSWGQP